MFEFILFTLYTMLNKGRARRQIPPANQRPFPCRLQIDETRPDLAIETPYNLRDNICGMESLKNK